ncbi:hypothetical protein C4561_02885 [candidate division WWE3 bacterium]|jgi:hypothetical protein|uniref:Uncharacterized protein n=1 Tax=candidate division WWE3 bacterium TaxID=2053526 RepID=A0A3A4ZJQ8_UNCKA|nr:MAG: hypothetical protein C4561_02885 [candidate division WWE3 bacterium]
MELHRDFVVMHVSLGNTTRKIAEEVNEVLSAGYLLTSALSSTLANIPLGIGANLLQVVWEFNRHGKNALSGNLSLDVYRASKIDEIASYVSAMIVKGINAEVSKETSAEVQKAFNEMLSELRKDPDFDADDEARLMSLKDLISDIAAL